MHKIYLPDLGEGIAKAQIVIWHKKENEYVEKNDDLVELVTDKASFNLEADQSGIIKKICVPEGREASIGTVLAIME